MATKTSAAKTAKNKPNSVNLKAKATKIEEKMTIKEEPKTTITEVKTEVAKEKTSKKPTEKLASKPRSRLNKLLDALVGEKKELVKYDKVVAEIEALEPEIQKLTDAQLKGKTLEFRAMLEGLEGKLLEAKLQEILPQAFAVVREASVRSIGKRHFPVQLIGAMVLNDGRIAEMKTGEGKTLVAPLAAYLNALPSKSQVHVVTVNDYLARVGGSWMGQVFDFLGMTVGVIHNQAAYRFKLGVGDDEVSDKKRSLGIVENYEDGVKQDSKTVLDVKHLVPCERKEAYWDEKTNTAIDIVYGVNSEFGFDYLRDNMASTPQEMSQKAGQVVAIIDEVDSILIDEARTPLIISSQDADSSARYNQFAEIAKRLTPEIDYVVDEKRKVVSLTELGIEKVEDKLSIKDLYGNAENVVLIHHLDQALKAHTLFRREKEYVVRDGEIVIVDEFTGRLMVGRRFNQGLHQAIEAKENQNVQAESKTVATITFQNYFRLYSKLAGMTGTAATESEELFKIYKLLVVTIPTNRPMVRKDLADKVFKTETGKFKAIVRDIADIHRKGQPILIGTTSIEKNLMLSKFLNEAGISHEVLNAKNHEQEARIISNAGRKGMVTLATNIAGRGVDIILGGNLPDDKKEQAAWQKEHDEVVSLGGLFVIGTERHESRRIDNQLRGRAGRQGDPGLSQFYISLEDYILRVFGGDRVSYYNILPIADDEAISNGILSRLIEEAQKRIEGQNYDIRKHVTEYDDVINRQRSVIYSRRRKVLLNEGFEWKDESQKSVIREVFRAIKQIQKPVNAKIGLDAKQLETASKELKEILALADFDADVLKVLITDYKFKNDKVATLLSDKLVHQLKTRWEIYEEKVQAAMVRFIFLRAIDVLWTEHLVTVDHLNDSVRLRGYSQKDPLVEFKQDGMSLFLNLLEEIDREVADSIFKVNPDIVPAGIMKS
jgi:preprotein translocase subunit SecA